MLEPPQLHILLVFLSSDVIVLFGLAALCLHGVSCFFFFFQAEDGIRDLTVTGVQTCALPICLVRRISRRGGGDLIERMAAACPGAVYDGDLRGAALTRLRTRARRLFPSERRDRKSVV